jgi:hypothetical protein
VSILGIANTLYKKDGRKFAHSSARHCIQKRQLPKKGAVLK